MVGPTDLVGLFQPQLFYNSMICVTRVGPCSSAAGASSSGAPHRNISRADGWRSLQMGGCRMGQLTALALGVTLSKTQRAPIGNGRGPGPHSPSPAPVCRGADTSSRPRLPPPAGSRLSPQSPSAEWTLLLRASRCHGDGDGDRDGTGPGRAAGGRWGGSWGPGSPARVGAGPGVLPVGQGCGCLLLPCFGRWDDKQTPEPPVAK